MITHEASVSNKDGSPFMDFTFEFGDSDYKINREDIYQFIQKHPVISAGLLLDLLNNFKGAKLTAIKMAEHSELIRPSVDKRGRPIDPAGNVVVHADA